MSTPALILSAAGVVGSLAWIAHLLHLARHWGKAVFLQDLAAGPPAGGWPTLAVVFAARDERVAIEAATRSMLAEDYPGLEVIAVDDRSVDGSGAILDALALQDARLKVAHVAHLPAAWLGKTHALQLGSGSTRASWILFTDADVIFEPDCLRKAVAFAEARGLDHLTAIPGVLAGSMGERSFLGLFGLLLSMHGPLGRIEDLTSKAHIGVGAFNLVRASAFRAIGGFAHLTLSVDDDMRLAQALKFAGYRPGVVFGRGSVSVRWQVGLGGMIRGLEKNFFGALGYRLDKALAVALGIMLLGIAPYLGLFVGPWWARSVSALGIASVAAILAAGNRQGAIGWPYALLLPAASLAVLASLARSVVLNIARRGVDWRGHHYPLRELKAHVRIRDAWTREVWRSTR